MDAEKSRAGCGRNLGGSITTSVHTFHSWQFQPASSVSSSSEVSDRCPFYGTIHGHYFHPQILPKSPLRMCRKQQKLKHRISVFTGLPPPVPQAHSDSVPWHCPWQNGLSQQLRNAVREDSTCLGRTSTEHFWQKILERKTNSHNFHASNRFPDQIFPWHTLLVIVLTHTFSCMHERPSLYPSFIRNYWKVKTSSLICVLSI